MEALLQIHSCFFSHIMKQRLLRGHAPQKRSNILDLANFLVSQENIGLTTPLSHCIAASPVKDV